MPNAFNFSASPFDCLTQDEQRLVRDHVDVAYFPKDALVLDVGIAPTHLWVIIKGAVAQYDEGELVANYGPDDCFDGRALVAGRSSSRFVATEEVVAYELQRSTVQDLIAGNAHFGALLFADLGAKLSALTERQSGNELQSFNMARVDEALVRPAIVVEADTDVLSVVRLFQEHKSTNVLVRDASTTPPRLGMFTATALQKAVLRGTPLDELPVGLLANYNLVKVRASDQVGDALALMQRHKIHRVVVVNGDEIKGVLESLDVFSFLANHSHLIGMRLDNADSVEQLAAIAGQITDMMGRQFRSGNRVGLIARLVQDLNARLFARAWQLIAPQELQENSCLFVMGSEGRGEQLLKTDQDNGLVLRDGYTPPADLAAICQRFSDALASFGYPPCPGDIMVSNAAWRMPVSDFTRTARQWLVEATPEGLMNLAIFMDAHAVSGDAHLLDEVRQGVLALATDNDAMLARFAAAIDAFASSGGWWNRLVGVSESHLNLKKEGTFPLVHGVRALALAHRITETGTAERIAALVQAGALSDSNAQELLESLHFFMGLKLKAGLAERQHGEAVTGHVDVQKLSTLDRDLLKDTLGVVKRFRAQLRQRFRLNAIG
jgi:CBS domain-containing protein